MADRVFSYEFRGKFDNLTAGFTAAGRSAQDFGGKLTALDRQGAKMRAGLDTLGGAAGKIGLVAAAGLGAAVLKAADFDQAMSNIQAATHETADGMDALREAALEAGARTAFSATEAAGAIENLAKAGVSTSDILSGGLSGALDLAAAGELDVASAAEIAATALTQFKLAGEDVPHVADLLAAGAGKAQGEVSDLSSALNQSGLVASQTGLSIEETVGTLSAFASAGLLGSDAGTSFKTMLQSLTPTSKQSAELMDQLGISAYDAQGNFIGMAEFAGVLQGALLGMSTEQQNATLKTIFGADAVRAASVLYSQGAEGIGEWTNKVDDAGYAAETAAIKMDNLKGDWEEFTGALETALIGAGDGSQGPLRSLVQGATDAVNAFNKMPAAAQNTATALLGVTAVLGGGLWFGAKVINGIASTRQALDDLGISAGRTSGSLGRLARTAGGITAVAGAVTILGNALAEATGAKMDTSGLSREIEALANGKNSDLLGRLTDDLEIVGDRLNRTAEPLKEVGTGFGLFGNTAMDNASDNLKAFDESLAGLVEGGNAEQAAAAFEQLAAARAGLAPGSSVADWVIEDELKNFDAYATALDNATVATEGTADAQGELGAAGAVGAEGMAQSAEASAAAAEALAEARDAATGTAQEFFNLGDGLNDASVSLGEWLTQMSEQAQALREFRINAQDAAQKGLNEGLIKSLQEAGPEGALRMKQLADAGQTEIGRANKVWREGQREIRKYADDVAGVPDAELDANGKPAAAEIARIERLLTKYGLTTENATAALDDVASGRIRNVQGLIDKYGMTKREATALLKDQASGAIAAVRSALNALDGKIVTTTIRTVRETVNKVTGAAANAFRGFGSADGSTVPKTGLPYADRHPYLLADGEEVISNRHGQADRWRPLLKAINYGRLANGGTAGMASYALERSTRSSSRNDASSMIAQLHRSAHGLKALSSALEKSEKIIDKERKKRQDLVSRRDEISGRVTDSLRSDIWETSGNAWSGAAADPLSALRADIAKAGEHDKLRKQLTAKGLDGNALEEALSEIDRARLLGGMTRAEVNEYERLYNRRERLTSAAGAASGVAVMGPELREQTRELRQANKRLDRLERAVKVADKNAKRNSDKNASDVTRGVNGAGTKGKRSQRRDR